MEANHYVQTKGQGEAAGVGGWEGGLEDGKAPPAKALEAKGRRALPRAWQGCSMKGTHGSAARARQSGPVHWTAPRAERVRQTPPPAPVPVMTRGGPVAAVQTTTPTMSRPRQRGRCCRAALCHGHNT